MSFLFIFESLIYYICLAIISVQIYGCALIKWKFSCSFIIFVPVIFLALNVSIEIFAFINLALHILQIFLIKFSIPDVKLFSVLYVFLFLFGINTLINSAILAFIPTNSITEIVFELMVHLLFGCSCILLCYSKANKKIKNTIILTPKGIKIIILSLILLSVLVSVLFFDIQSLNTTNGIARFAFQAFIILISLVCVTFPILIVISMSNGHLKKITKNYEEQIEAQAAHYTALAEANFELRRFRHDLKNIQIGVRELIAQGNYEEALDILDHSEDKLYQTSTNTVFFDTGNGIVDALLAEKQKKAAESNTKIVFDGAIPTVSITAAELCVLFGNTIDNAIEACQKIGAEAEKIIRIHCTCNGGFMFLDISNPVFGPISIKNNGIETTKTDKTLHGFGLYSLDKVLKNHDGELALSCEEKIFAAKINMCLC